VVDNRHAGNNPATAEGKIELTAGKHTYELRYVWAKGQGFLEAFWARPGEQIALIGPNMVRTGGGAWLPGSVDEPPKYRLPP
jgi:hypothetical protein